MSPSELPRIVNIRTKQFHLAVMREPFLTYVFEGKKTIESRFSLHKIAPYQKVEPGDTIFMKAGPIVGYFTVAWVKYFDLTAYPVETLQQSYNEAICGDNEFWKAKGAKRYATLIGISNVQRVDPIAIQKHDRRAWVAVEI